MTSSLPPPLATPWSNKRGAAGPAPGSGSSGHSPRSVAAQLEDDVLGGRPGGDADIVNPQQLQLQQEQQQQEQLVAQERQIRRLREEVEELQSQRDAMASIAQSLERQLQASRLRLQDKLAVTIRTNDVKEKDMRTQHVKHVVLAVFLAAIVGLPLGFVAGALMGWTVGVVMCVFLLAPSFFVGIALGTFLGYVRIVHAVVAFWQRLFGRAEAFWLRAKRVAETGERVERLVMGPAGSASSASSASSSSSASSASSSSSLLLSSFGSSLLRSDRPSGPNGPPPPTPPPTPPRGDGGLHED